LRNLQQDIHTSG